MAHGFARLTDWEVAATEASEDQGTMIRFQLPPSPAAVGWPAWRVELNVRINQRLELELAVTNASREDVLEFEACFHTYLAVGDVRTLEVAGLESAPYHDHVSGADAREGSSPLRISAQTDRTYLRHPASVKIYDPVLHRVLRIEKSGARSTVLWNPWTTQPLPDLSEGEHQRMLCVESGNVGPDRVRLKPGEVSRMSVFLSSAPRR